MDLATALERYQGLKSRMLAADPDTLSWEESITILAVLGDHAGGTIELLQQALAAEQARREALEAALKRVYELHPAPKLLRKDALFRGVRQVVLVDEGSSVEVRFESDYSGNEFEIRYRIDKQSMLSLFNEAYQQAVSAIADVAEGD